jgi:hypothetical protein
MQLGETLRAAYQILVDLTVIGTFLPFVYIFASGFKFGQRWAGAVGGLITVLAIVLSAVPPPGVASLGIFELKVVGGTILLALAARPIYARGVALAP